MASQRGSALAVRRWPTQRDHMQTARLRHWRRSRRRIRGRCRDLHRRRRSSRRGESRTQSIITRNSGSCRQSLMPYSRRAPSLTKANLRMPTTSGSAVMAADHPISTAQHLLQGRARCLEQARRHSHQRLPTSQPRNSSFVSTPEGTTSLLRIRTPRYLLLSDRLVSASTSFWTSAT